MKRIANALGKLCPGRTLYAVLLCATAAVVLPAQPLSTLHSFDLADGALPDAALVQGTDGDLYGTTTAGGAKAIHGGTVFKITPSGTLTVLYSFCSHIANYICADGEAPGALMLATDGNFYGTTNSGGFPCGPVAGCGTIFKMTPSGTLTTLYSFCSPTAQCPDGLAPNAALVQAADGNFYGTTSHGGAFGDGGTVFKITPTGTLATLYSFCSQTGCTDGATPVGPLVQDSNGDFYGTTVGGGTGEGVGGTVFKITPSGTLTTLYNFCSETNCLDGSEPFAGLVQAANGEFYGTTCLYGPHDSGTVFKITPSGALTTIYSFCSQGGCSDGENPLALIRAPQGDFYGTTAHGGANCSPYGCGTVFRITAAGKLTTLLAFCSQNACKGGTEPQAGLVQATSGDFNGTTYNGGASDACPKGCGTVFSLSLGLSPFVETLPISGQAGTTVRILGTGLTVATGVTFNGRPSMFEAISGSEIVTTVPAGASTGKVQVATPSGTLSSNVAFRVRP